jgi:hypothetical protein
MLQPALLGGVAMGVLSALPVINLANCCCAWILFGGGLAAYLMQQGRPTPISAGDGALVGLLAGVVGAVVWTVVSIPLNAAMLPLQTSLFERALENAGDMPPEARAFLESLSSGPVMGAAAVFGFIIALFVCSFFGMIGGLFGALLFKKSAPPPPPTLGGGFTPPPPPPTLGGGFTPPTFTPPPMPGSDR